MWETRQRAAVTTAVLCPGTPALLSQPLEKRPGKPGSSHPRRKQNAGCERLTGSALPSLGDQKRAREGPLWGSVLCSKGALVTLTTPHPGWGEARRWRDRHRRGLGPGGDQKEMRQDQEKLAGAERGGMVASALLESRKRLLRGRKRRGKKFGGKQRCCTKCFNDRCTGAFTRE